MKLLLSDHLLESKSLIINMIVSIIYGCCVWILGEHEIDANSTTEELYKAVQYWKKYSYPDDFIIQLLGANSEPLLLSSNQDLLKDVANRIGKYIITFRIPSTHFGSHFFTGSKQPLQLTVVEETAGLSKKVQIKTKFIALKRNIIIDHCNNFFVCQVRFEVNTFTLKDSFWHKKVRDLLYWISNKGNWINSNNLYLLAEGCLPYCCCWTTRSEARWKELLQVP